MKEKLMEIENAVIELEKVRILLNLVVSSVETNPTVEDVQNAFFIFEELFRDKFATLKNAVYGGSCNA